MRYDKLPHAERLFDAIGLIEDGILVEAETTQVLRPYVRRRGQIRSLIALACAFSVITAGVLGSALVSLLFPTGESHAPESSAPDASTPVLETLQESLQWAESSGAAATVSDVGAIDFFDGTAKIIWRGEDESQYRVITVASPAEADRILDRLKVAGTPLAPDSAYDPTYSVWISRGDGTVVSPYLKPSAGNVGYACLFDYAPEVEPDEELAALIRGVVTDGSIR